MKYQIKTSSRFKRDLKRCAKRGLDMQLVYDAMNLLAKDGLLPAEYKPHQLKGDHKGQWECHIQPNPIPRGVNSARLCRLFELASLKNNG